MNGLKTAVKTEWKNLMHGTTRLFIDSFDAYLKDRIKVWALGTNSDEFPKSGNVCLSYHVKWENYYFLPRIASSSHWTRAGEDVYESSGEMDVVWVSKVDNFDTTDTKLFVPFFSSNYNTKPYTGGREIYIELSNIMLNIGDKPLPYIDSDELKAAGGVTYRTVIVALRLNKERRAA